MRIVRPGTAMDTPTPTPTPAEPVVPVPVPRPPPDSASPPAPVITPVADAPGSPTPGSPVAHTSRAAQVALGVFVAVTLALLAFRGYGNGLGARPTDHPSPAAIDLNHAGRAELEQVPGIGPALAREIEQHREKNGPFRSVEQLRQVKGVGPATFDKLRPFLRVDVPVAADQPPAGPADTEPMVLERKPPAAAPYPRAAGSPRKLQPGDPPVNVNTATVEQLMQLPGVGAVTAQHIVAARSEKPFASVDDLDRVKGIGRKTLDKIRPFAVVK